MVGMVMIMVVVVLVMMMVMMEMAMMVVLIMVRTKTNKKMHWRDQFFPSISELGLRVLNPKSISNQSFLHRLQVITSSNPLSRLLVDYCQ